MVRRSYIPHIILLLLNLFLIWIFLKESSGYSVATNNSDQSVIQVVPKQSFLQSLIGYQQIDQTTGLCRIAIRGGPNLVTRRDVNVSFSSEFEGYGGVLILSETSRDNVHLTLINLKSIIDEPGYLRQGTLIAYKADLGGDLSFLSGSLKIGNSYESCRRFKLEVKRYVKLESKYKSKAAEVYVVNFRNSNDVESQNLDRILSTALSISGVNAEEVVFDATTTDKWEKSANEAFDRNIVPVFNKWVGLTGFAVIVDAKSKLVIGCVNSKFETKEMAHEIRMMTSHSKISGCPAAHNPI